ncbi:hypothetical protein OSB04_012998 [Centaurea solstitialis]|uniref:Uncharacterized protein n=1 Tax=Centaurea solstitialis TaxID=347529 RepID=A0AA38TE59_9ASTR|nr:hypothetical protein OSB04_012998 [Centaurea solstitialis]
MQTTRTVGMKIRVQGPPSVIKAIHEVSGRDFSSLANLRKSEAWLNIAKVEESLSSINLDLDDHFTRKVGDGNDIFFWSDRWLGGIPLKCISQQNLYIAMKFLHRNGEGIHQLEDILHVELVPVEDGWPWEGDPNGEFTVTSLRSIIDNLTYPFLQILFLE